MYGKLADIFGRKVRAPPNLLFPFFPYVDLSVPSVCPLHKYNHLSGRISPLRCCSGETFSFFGITPQMSALCTTISLMIYTSSLGHAVAHHCPGSRGCWGWWHCQLCVDHNDRNRAPQYKGKVVAGPQCDMVCFCRCRSDLGRRLLRWASLPRASDRLTQFTPASHTGEVATGFSWRWACEYSFSFPSGVMGWTTNPVPRAVWINIPIGIIALAIIAWCLHSVPNVRRTTDGELDTRSSREVYLDILRTFDYLGLSVYLHRTVSKTNESHSRVLLMGSTSALVIGFSFAGQEGWSTPRTLGLILTGIGGLLLAFVWETFVGTRALLPPGLFKQATVVNVLAISILHNFAFNAGTYFIPVYYQAVDGDTPFRAGMRVLPFSLGSALASVPVAQFISFRTGPAWIDRSLKISICLGMALATIGYGMCICLTFKMSISGLTTA